MRQPRVRYTNFDVPGKPAVRLSQYFSGLIEASRFARRSRSAEIHLRSWLDLRRVFGNRALGIKRRLIRDVIHFGYLPATEVRYRFQKAAVAVNCGGAGARRPARA